MDVHQTRDGALVVIHDETVDRTTNGSGAVIDLTLAEIVALDAGDGATIPEIGEVMAFAPDTPMIIEVKENDLRAADQVIAYVRAFDRADRTLIGSFHQEVLDHVRRTAPDIATHASEGEVITFLVASWLGLAGVVTPPYEAFLVPPQSGPIPVTTRRFLNAARRRGLFVAAWTVNDRAQMVDLAARGIDGIITDRPDLLLNVRSAE
jgi:glycerophosphoryl diester phosphodiesterase